MGGVVPVVDEGTDLGVEVPLVAEVIDAVIGGDTWRDDAEIDAVLAKLWTTMQACVDRGLSSPGVLPGRLRVTRLAVNDVER